MQPRQGVTTAVAPDQTSQIVGDGREPEMTRTALTGALVRQVAGDPSGLGQPTGSIAEDGDDPDAGRSADRSQGYGSVWSGELPGADPCPSVSADQERLHKPHRLAQHGDVRQGGPVVHFDHPWVVDVTADRDQTRSWLLARPAAPKEPRSVAGDEGDVGQGLRVVDQRSAPPDAKWRALVRPEYRK
jgi:hypothetical protein